VEYTARYGELDIRTTTDERVNDLDYLYGVLTAADSVLGEQGCHQRVLGVLLRVTT
jgi:hypothetical protein